MPVMIYDERPDFAPHSDFLRFDYLAHQKDRSGYLKLLGQTQLRWKPDDPHWQFTAAAALRELCDLVQSDPRGTNFSGGYAANARLALCRKRRMRLSASIRAFEVDSPNILGKNAVDVTDAG